MLRPGARCDGNDGFGRLKILILKPSSLGDVIHALPVLRLLKAHWPEASIWWWISHDLAELLKEDPDLAGVYLFDRRRWVSPTRWGTVVRSVRQMRRERFDLVIDLQGLARSAAFSWLARGKLTVGLDDPREGAGAFYDIRVPRPSYDTHAVDWYLTVLSRLNVSVHWNFTWLPARTVAAEEIRKKWLPDDASKWIVFSPGARWPNKRWPAENFRQIAAQIAGRYPDTNMVVLGGSEDRETGELIARGHAERCLNLAGDTSLGEMIEWIRLSDLVITNDTGPMHVAAALDKPVVAIFGPTDPRRTGPYRQLDRTLRVRLPCAPCLKSKCHHSKPLECLTAIDPGRVLAEVEMRLARRIVL